MRATVWSDDDLLQWVRLRCNGVTTRQIAQEYGATQSYVIAATNRVKTADIAHSGEDARAGCW